MNKIFITLLSLIICMRVGAQTITGTEKKDSLITPNKEVQVTPKKDLQITPKKESLLFKHLGVGGSIGSTGLGIEVATSLNAHFALRANFQVFDIGTIKIKLPVTNGGINDALDIDDPYINEAARTEKVGLDLKIKMISGDILADYYPWKNKSFHITAGLFFGNRNFFHFHNHTEGELRFLNVSNSRVVAYNQAFGTTYKEIGLQFGDYVFTADENGNMDAKLKVWAVRPYIGIGWGRGVSLSIKRKVNFNFDLGTQFWGAPKCVLNNENTVSSRSKKNGGIAKVVSGFIFWPALRLTISGDIF